MTRIAASALLLLALWIPSPASAACHAIPTTSWSPSGIAGCSLYGTGIASEWQGPGVARNDCIYPWTDCQPIAIQSLDTGIVIVVTPQMFGDLYTGTSRERLVDLDPAAVWALGLDPSRGLFPVKVWPVDGATGLPVASQGTMPDTSTR